MLNAVLALPSHLRSRLVKALDCETLAEPYTETALSAVLGGHADCGELLAALNEVSRLGVSSRASAAWIRSLEAAKASRPIPDLVWSGPEVPGVHARDTRRVYEELLGSVEESVWVSTYAFFDGPRAFEVLSKRLDDRPSIQASLLLNIQRKWGDTTEASALVRRFTERFWEVDWPGSVRPAVYYDPRSLDLERASGVLHAKAVVADNRTVFVTSANLTEAALDRNFELGFLVRDSALAMSVASHFQALVDQSLLVRLPAE
jgi:phosphatidylserine/phosphatidylglycerophosphate/cardiolipin synthase-like enzyme